MGRAAKNDWRGTDVKPYNHLGLHGLGAEHARQGFIARRAVPHRRESAPVLNTQRMQCMIKGRFRGMGMRRVLHFMQ